MISRWFLIHILCLLHLLNAAPVTERPNPESCSEVCSGDTDLVDFGVFKSHVYSVRINHRITSPLSSTGHINYVINGTAEILGGTDCNYELRDASNSMVLDGAQTCIITLPAGGPVSHAECSENMTVSGLVRGNLTTINTVSVNTVLHLISSDTGATPSTGKEESIRRIAFGHTAVFADADPKAADLVEASQTLAAVLVSDFTDRATSFSKLIRLIRRMEPDQLEELYNIYKDTQQAKDLLSEAVYSAGTRTALTHLKNVLKEGRLSTPILQLSMLPSPTLEQIETIRVISTLRAIGNSGRVSNTGDMYPVLERCLRQPNIFVRSAAAEAFRKFPCDEKADVSLILVHPSTKLQSSEGKGFL
ncbi:hypothetical protein SprV_0301065500 [Sparganum proliferum]